MSALTRPADPCPVCGAEMKHVQTAVTEGYWWHPPNKMCPLDHWTVLPNQLALWNRNQLYVEVYDSIVRACVDLMRAEMQGYAARNDDDFRIAKTNYDRAIAALRQVVLRANLAHVEAVESPEKGDDDEARG